MAPIPAYSEEELEACGFYPVVGLNYGMEQYPIERYNFPITPKENWRRFIAHEEFAWVPDPFQELNVACPDVYPDNIACGFAGGLDSFGVSWIPSAEGAMLPAFVDPNNQLLESIEDWHDLEFPDIDSWDWEGASKLYAALDPERPTLAVMQSGLFERMIAISSYEEAAASFLECPEDVEELLDRLTDFNIGILEHHHKYFGSDAVVFHDDWGTERSPAFSEEILSTYLIPRIARVVKRAHELDMAFIMHSCGNITRFVPYMIEAGCDVWQYNHRAVKDTIVETIEEYSNRICFHGYVGDVEPLRQDTEGFVADVRAMYATLCPTSSCALSISDYEDHGIDSFRYYYECARKRADEIFGR